MKNTLLLFSKVPEVGLVKTRLTTLKDGIFSPEVASALYHCMLFDVVEICCDALAALEARDRKLSGALEVCDTAAPGARERACEILRAHEREECGEEMDGLATHEPATCGLASHDVVTSGTRGQETNEYELVISTAPAANLEKMRALFSDAGEWPRELIFRTDSGKSFDEHYNDAFQQCWDAGSDCILSMGADMPALTVQDVVRGFDALHDLRAREPERGGLVMAPDQEMGVSIIGWTRETVFDHTSVFYNADGLTVLPAYVGKARDLGLPMVYLPPVPDVDTMQDFRHNVTLVEALNYTAPFSGNTPPWRTAQALDEMGWSEIRVMPNGLLDPRGHIDV